MKEFGLFVGPFYDPAGGMGDFKGSFDTIEDTFYALDRITYAKDWWQIVIWDAEAGLIVVQEHF